MLPWSDATEILQPTWRDAAEILQPFFWNDTCCRLIEILWSPETIISVLTDEQNKFRRDLYTYDIL